MSIKKKVLFLTLSIFILLTSLLLIRTVTAPCRHISNIPEAHIAGIEPDEAAKRLAEALKFKTVSYREADKFNYSEFEKLHEYLAAAFPLTHKKLKVEKVNNYSLLYTWEGKDNTLKPVILTAHMDVVDVEKETMDKWLHGPFSGDIADGKIWGRGARDNKCQVVSALEAVEYLLQKGMEPERTIILAFGHDEEVLGVNGAKKIADLLIEQKVTPECVIDEGGAVVEKAIPGLKGQTAIIATGEKGYLTLELSVNTAAGHSSEPAEETTIGILSRAVTKLEENKFPATLREVEPMLTYTSSEMKFPFNLIFRNLWLTGGIVKGIMLSKSETSSMVRTTVAPTIIEGGYQDNVIPAHAKAILNLRLLPGDTVDKAMASVEKTIDDKRVRIKKVGYYTNAPAASSTETDSFKTLAVTINQIFPDALCTPYFSTGGTDTKHYASLTPNLYRFTPSVKEKDEKGHGINERIPVDNYMQYISYYVNLIINFGNGKSLNSGETD